MQEKYPDVDAVELLGKAAEQLKKSARPDPEALLGFIFEGLRACYAGMFRIGDFDGAIRALKELKKMAGG